VTLDNDCQSPGSKADQARNWDTLGTCLLYPPELRAHFLARMEAIRTQYGRADLTMEHFAEADTEADTEAAKQAADFKYKRNKSPLMAAVWTSVRAAIRAEYPNDYPLVMDALMTAMHHLGKGGMLPGDMGLPSWWNNMALHVASAASPLDTLAFKLEAKFQACNTSLSLRALESKLALVERTDVRTAGEHKKYLANLAVKRVKRRAPKKQNNNAKAQEKKANAKEKKAKAQEQRAKAKA
jgi:hypothetical protein